MKFSMASTSGRTQITATTGEFDGMPPVPHLEIGLNLEAGTNADRLAVGLSLTYSPWLAGPVTFPNPVSTLTAQRITEFFGDRFVTATNVTDRALPIPRGTRTVAVIDGARERQTSPTSPSVRLAPFSRREGAIFVGDHITAASNVHVLGAGIGPEPFALQLAGVSVMLSEHADANVLALPASAEDAHRLNLLLEAVGLGCSSG